jgi:hypothetical protein
VTKYNVPDDYWDEGPGDEPPDWADRTSADIEIDVTLHEQGYQEDRKWTVHVWHRGPDSDAPAIVAGFAVEHQNKGNFWREGSLWNDAVDFVELPQVVRERVAAVLDRDVAAITPAERSIHRADGTGLGDPDEDPDPDTVECGQCGKQRYSYERCQHCGYVHWRDSGGDER